MKLKQSRLVLSIVTSAFLMIAAGPKPSHASESFQRLGKTMVGFESPFIEIVVDYKFADASLGENWLILNVAITSSQSEATEVRSDSVLVMTPDGREIPLPAYSQFSKAYPEYQSAARRAALASDPVDFTHGGRATCELAFQPLPGTTVALESVYVNMRKICQGLLFFPVEGGIQPGTWQFVIEFDEFETRVPFVLGESR